MKLLQSLFLPQISYNLVLFIIRIAWVFYIIQYQSIALLLESLVMQDYIVPVKQKVFFIISSFFLFCFAVIAIVDFHCMEPSQRMFSFEPLLQNFSTFYSFFFLIFPSLFLVIQKIRLNFLPAILKKQLKILIQGLVIPLLSADFIQIFPFKIYGLTWIAHSYAGVSVSTMLITLAIYFCARKIFGLRFLNLKSHVQRPMNINFVDDFKRVLERLSSVTSLHELGHIAQIFFKDTFFIPLNRTHFYLRKVEKSEFYSNTISSDDAIASLVESFLATYKGSIKNIIKKEKILIYDEIDFNHFYDACDEGARILHFLRAINADIFLPIYANNKLIAYIVVDRHARTSNFYSGVERDELIVFSSYLGNIINLLQSKSLDLLIEQEQNLRKELYHKHQEINQYKESIRSFVRKGRTQHIGVIFYKGRQFYFGNQAAQDMVAVNLNIHHGHFISQALRKIVHQVESFKITQSLSVTNAQGVTLIFSAVPHLEDSSIIITVSYPDLSDTIKHSIDLLKDPTEWDYFLYLQTTASGKLINKIIPGNGPTILNFKIELLRLALSKKAILLDIIEQDIFEIATIVHHISLRETLHVLVLDADSQPLDIAVKLFGMNPIFIPNPEDNKPLLELLDGVGTLFIKNIHLLDLEAQENLALYIRYGYYTTFKSDQKVVSDVRIICSSNQNLSLLAQHGKFSKALFQELKMTMLVMPSLLTLSDEELDLLAEGFTQQSLVSDDLHHILLLTEKEKRSLMVNRPISLQELKDRIQQMIIKKSKKNMINHDVEIHSLDTIADADLLVAARLGKQALKDPKMMILLWNKFKNQNKISEFLGVNRSSVNRRCKEYNLID